MNSEKLVALLKAALPLLESCRDELRDLDAAIGDGDLGITVAGGAAAVVRELEQVGHFATPALVLRQAAGSFAAANPSTLSALVAGALLAAAKRVVDAPELDRSAAIDILTAAINRIAERGKALPGDKTILDAMSPSLEALATAPADPVQTMELMVSAARSGVESTTALISRRGRAAWVGERSIGHPDGGATAYLRLLEAIATAFAGAAQRH